MENEEEQVEDEEEQVVGEEEQDTEEAQDVEEQVGQRDDQLEEGEKEHVGSVLSLQQLMTPLSIFSNVQLLGMTQICPQTARGLHSPFTILHVS